MDRDSSQRQRSVARELRVDTEGDWTSTQPSPRRVATAPSSPSTAYTTDRETTFHSGSATVSETHVIRSSGSQSQSYTEEHWSSEITSFVATAPPKFIQVIKAYRILSSDTPTLVVEVASEPPAIFEWFCNDKPVMQDKRRFQARHGLNITTLTIHKPEQGVYKCTARNPAGCSTSYGYINVNFEHRYEDWSIQEKSTSSTSEQQRKGSTASITYNHAPRFTSQVPNLTVSPGSEAVIDVEVDADPPARFSWFVNGKEFRDSADNVELYYPQDNRCVARFSIPVSGQYKVVASNVHGSAMSSGYVEIYQAVPTRQARPPMPPGEHMARTMMTTSQHTGHVSGDVQQITSTQTMSVYEVNYAQRSSSVPRGVRHLEKHVEVATGAPESKFMSSSARNREPRPMHKTRSDGSRYLPHPPRFLTQLPKEITAKSNEKLVLSVDVSALPAAEIKWNVNGFEVKPSKSVTLLNEQNKSTLVLNPPIKQGKYNVTAMNDIGKDTLVTKVITIVTETVEEIQSEISIGPTAAPGIVESAVTVTSAPESEWEIIDNVSEASSTSQETVLKKAQVAAQAAVSTEPVEQFETKKEELVVQQKEEEISATKEQTTLKVSYTKMAARTTEDMPRKPAFTQQPVQLIHVSGGERLVLESFVDSSPPSTFQWYVNNFEVRRGEFIIIEQPTENQSRVIFLRPAPGQYKVVATNIHGQVETVTRVTTETVQEDYQETTTVTSTVRPVMFRLQKKNVAEKDNLPKAPIIIERLKPNTKIPEGHCLLLKVAADAIPEAVFTWLLNNFELKSSNNVSIVSAGSNQSELRIQNPGAGKYEVIARNNMGQVSSSCKVVLEYADQETPPVVPPKFSFALAEETFVAEEETRFVVAVSGIPPYQFDWFVNGEDYNIFKVVEDNRSLLILPSPPPEGRIVSVTVKNSYGTASTQTTVRNAPQPAAPTEEPKSRAPVIVKSLENLEITQGDSLVWGIGVDREGSPCTFDWILDHEKLESDREMQIDSTGYESVLSWTTAAIGGEMTVVVSNQHGKAVSSAVLTVAGRAEHFEMVAPDLPEESAPKIIAPLHSMTFLDGQPMILRCQIKAIPSAAVEWTKDDVNVEEWVINKDVTTQIYPDGVCELVNPECFPEDSGLYKCQASNPYGTAETSAFISIEPAEYKKDREEASMSESFASELHPLVGGEEIILPPKFVEPLSAELDGVEQLNYIRLVCRAISGSPFSITWKKDDLLLASSERLEFYQFEDGTQILTIHRPTAEDNGIYTCTAESDQGLASTSTEVVLQRERKESIDIEIVQMPPAEVPPQVAAPVEVELIAKVAPGPTTPKAEEVAGITEIRKNEEEFKLLVKVADSVASTLVANVFVDAVREAARRIIAEESSEEEELEIETGAPRFDTSVEEYVATEGGPIKISISVSGYPTPFVEWYFGEKKLNITENLSMSYEKGVASLNLKTVHFDHAGTYYLQATNPHGTTVLSTKLKVVQKPSDMNIRTSLAKYDKQEADEKVVTNVFAQQPEPTQQQDIKGLVKRSDSQTASTIAKEDEFEFVKKEESSTPPDFEIVETKPEVPQQPEVPKEAVVEQQQQVTPTVLETVEEPMEQEPIPEGTSAPPKLILPEEKPVPAPRTKKAEAQAAEQPSTQVSVTPVESAIDPEVKRAAEKFAESFTEKVLNQAQDIVLTAKAMEEHKETQVVKTLTTIVLDREEESGRRSVTMPFEEKVKTIESRLEAAASPDLSAEQAVNMVMETLISLKKEHLADQDITVDVRNPDGRFDHVVTVVEPDVLQLSSKISAAIPQLKFIDIDTILQKPGTSQQTDCLLSTQSKKNANAEHRIIVLEGASQNFHDAMTWSLRKVQRLADDERFASTNVEVARPLESSSEVTAIVDAEKIIPELLQVAAAASKLKLENVTVSLVRRGDSAHTQLVIEYESQLEDESDQNQSHLECERPVETKEEMWSRRSRFSEEDERVAGVFVEVDAVCPDQNVEIMATVNMPIETSAEQPFEGATAESVEHSQSVTETSGALQPPKFFRQLVDSQAVIGHSVQFKCIVSGTPTPRVVWSVDGDVIEPNHEYSIVYEDGVSILKINEVVSEDEGEYWCEAINAAGQASTKCFLKVLYGDWQSGPLEASSDPDSTDLFEWEERKIQELIDRENALLASLEQSRISRDEAWARENVSCSYNEDLAEVSAFHKYFETAETAVLITELYELGAVEATVAASPRKTKLERVNSTSTTDASFHNKKKNSFAVASTRLEKQSSRESADITTTDDLWDSKFNNPFGPESEVKADTTRMFEPRIPLLPMKMSYKGQKIDVLVNEVEKEEKVINLEGKVEIAKKTSVETSLEFNSSLGNPKKISTKKMDAAQPPIVEEIDDLKAETSALLAAMERAERELKQLEDMQLVGSAEDVDDSSILSVNNSEAELIALLRESQTRNVEMSVESPAKAVPKSENPGLPKPKEELASVPTTVPQTNPKPIEELPNDNPGNSKSESSTKLMENPGEVPVPPPVPHLEAAPSTSTSMSNQQFINTMKQIERIARNVEHELAELSHSSGNELSDDAKSIEEAILMMSDRLVMQYPLTEAQAEATEELMRTTLADMILNPSRTVEEEIEIMKRPIRLLRRRISEIENSLMEDAEVKQLVETPSKSTPDTILSPAVKIQRVPSAELVRMTPLTTNIKDQLTQLEDMINEHMESEGTESYKAAPAAASQKRRELHHIFMQINDEINTIRVYCSKKLTKKGSDSVMNVLHKVRTHITSIVNVLSLAKKKKAKPIQQDVFETFYFVKDDESLHVDSIMVYKNRSLESSSLQQSSTHRTSAALTTSDDTWRFSKIDFSSTRTSADTKEETLHTFTEEQSEVTPKIEDPLVEEPPKPPPRRKRTASADPRLVKSEEAVVPVPPPRTRKEQMEVAVEAVPEERKSRLDEPSPKLSFLGKTASLDRRHFFMKKTSSEKASSSAVPAKPKRSFVEGALGLFKHLKNPLRKKEKRGSSEEYEPLVNEEQSDDHVLQFSDKSNILDELRLLSMECQELNLEPTVEPIYDEVARSASADKKKETTPPHVTETCVDDYEEEDIICDVELNFEEQLPQQETINVVLVVPPHQAKLPDKWSDEAIHTSYTAVQATDSFTTENELFCNAVVIFPQPQQYSADYSVNVEDTYSVQMLCEESDYATDTDTSGMLKGSVQFFRASPLIPHKEQPAKIMEESFEGEVEEVMVNVELRSVDADEAQDEAEYSFAEMLVYESDLDSEGVSEKPKSEILSSETRSDRTAINPIEEAQISEMFSSSKTVDEQETPILTRETDILSDESQTTEVEAQITAYFDYTRLAARRKIIAQVSQEIFSSATASIAENLFEVVIEQEPENLGLIIKVTEEQADFTSLTVFSGKDDEHSETQEAVVILDGNTDITETSSFDEYEGDNSRTGINVSIIARSLHDSIYASLEEIPWGEVQMTLKENEMCRSVDTSLQFNVTVSENADERKSLRSQPSQRESQNSISESNTLSNSSINIPSYVIKLGSTATITCELNNYLSPNSKIEWVKGKKLVVRTPGKFDRISHDLLEVLIINNVDYADNELYSLKVNDDVFPVAFLLVDEAADELPTILSPSQTQFVMEGQPTEIFVQVNKNAQDVEWFKDKKPLKDSSRMATGFTDNYSKVIFLETRISDQGTYVALLGEQTVATTLVVEERIDEKEVTVVASGTESEDDDIQEYLVPPGSTATIACELEESDNCRSLVWIRDSRPLVFNQPNKLEHVINGLKHYLVIHDTGTGDSGLYSVSISGTEFRVAHLVVNDLATSMQSTKRKRVSNVSLNK